jgi:hypothetical protein
MKKPRQVAGLSSIEWACRMRQRQTHRYNTTAQETEKAPQRRGACGAKSHEGRRKRRRKTRLFGRMVGHYLRERSSGDLIMAQVSTAWSATRGIY